VGRPFMDSLVGLEIDDREIRMAVARPAREGYVLSGHRRALPEGAVVSDLVVDAEAVSEALRGLMAASGVRPQRTCLVLGGERAICRVEPLALEDDPNARADCEERLRRYVMFGGRPVAVSHALQPTADEDGYAGRLLSAAAPEALVMRQAELAKRCGLTVLRAEPTIVAVVRALLAAETKKKRARFLLVAEGNRCEIGILRHDALVFCRRVAIPDGPEAAAGQWLVAALDQLQDYHLRHARGKELIDELLCCGSVDTLAHALGQLGAAGIRVTWVDPATFAGVGRVEGEGLHDKALRSAIAPAMAAAVTQMAGVAGQGGINLLPRTTKKRRNFLLSPRSIVPALLTLVATCGVLVWGGFVRRETSRLAYLTNNPSPEMLESSRLLRLESRLRQRVADGELLLKSVERHAVPELLAALPRQMPAEAWLARLTLERGGRWFIEGKAPAEDAVFEFAASLRNSPIVDTVRIDRTESNREGGIILTQFRLEVTLARPAGPEAESKGPEAARKGKE